MPEGVAAERLACGECRGRQETNGQPGPACAQLERFTSATRRKNGPSCRVRRAASSCSSQHERVQAFRTGEVYASYSPSVAQSPRESLSRTAPRNSRQSHHTQEEKDHCTSGGDFLPLDRTWKDTVCAGRCKPIRAQAFIPSSESSRSEGHVGRCQWRSEHFGGQTKGDDGRGEGMVR